MFSSRFLAVATALLSGFVACNAQTSSPLRSLTEDMGITQKLGDTVATDAVFKTETGETTKLGELFEDRPVVLFPIYYSCPSGCPKLFENVMKTVGLLNPMGRNKPIKMADTVDLRVGRDFDIVFLSLNPEETPAQALEKESQIVRNLEDQTIRDGWHFLTGDLENIRKVTDSMGFKWAYRPEENVLNHPTGSVTLTPNGKIVGYSIGNDLPTIFFRKNLEFARRDEVGPPADQSRMFGCIRIPASASKYRGTIELALKITGVVFVLVTVGLISFLTIKYRQPSLPSGRVTGA